MMKNFFTIVFLVLFNICLFGQFESPKEELRGVWIAALGIDWPSNTGTSAAVIQNQKTQLTNIFDYHRSQGLNTVFLHMRPMCDALYKSSYEPWSHNLTGTQGVAPSDPNYDPLKFAVEEAHNRGMELHAWLNPYRASLQNGSPVSSTHVRNTHPEWIIKCSGTEYRFLNPGLPAVRKYVVKIVMDIVRRYDVDGIHFDDYFYPYAAYGSFNDDAAFASYPNGFTNKSDWRKNNVNLLLEMIDDSIKAVKPWVKFGISPSGNPSVNNEIFCDPESWLAGNYTDSTGTSFSGQAYIDYIMPQLYWSRYNNLLSVWANSAFLNDRHLYIGQAAYRYGTSSMPEDEASWEININRKTPTVKGGVYFSSKSLTNNLGYGSDTLRYRYFTHPSITPKMNWIESGIKKPDPPANLRFEVNSSTLKNELHWDKPAPTAAGDTAFFYVIYRSENNPPDINDSTNMFGLTGTTFLSSNDSRYSVTKGNNYAVTSIDRYSNESDISNVVSLDSPSLIPDKPVLVSPNNNSNELGSTANLTWTNTANAERYLVQVAKDSTFTSELLLLEAGIRNYQKDFRGIVPGEKYFWRVKAFGQVGESVSDVYSFKSGISMPPILNSPPHATLNVSLTPTLNWFNSEAAESYRIQLSTSVLFQTNTFIYDKTISDTALIINEPLTPNKKYFWRVSAINSFGASGWSDQFGFQTTSTVNVEDEELPIEYNVLQNYPNPFNPETTINFAVAKTGFVSLKVFDLLGKEVANLVNKELARGDYSIDFNASNLSSGTYIYRLTVNGIVISKKMVFLK